MLRHAVLLFSCVALGFFRVVLCFIVLYSYCVVLNSCCLVLCRVVTHVVFWIRSRFIFSNAFKTWSLDPVSFYIKLDHFICIKPDHPLYYAFITQDNYCSVPIFISHKRCVFIRLFEIGTFRSINGYLYLVLKII